MEECIIETYEYIFQRLISDPSYSFKRSKSNMAMLKKFLKMIPENAGKEWVFDYMIFQFSRYYENSGIDRGIVPFNNVVSKKALEAWNKRTEQHVYYANKFKLRLGIVKETNYEIKASNEYKDSIRKRFLNKDRGLIYCKEHLLKREKGNKYCLRCKFKNICNKIQTDLI